ncbi:MAG TPA: DUF2652 domain-containing protein [Microbacterium sp.]|jgi:hypothetical protein|nr:DUF2652 domain-containing protein [Microbacterium sp.]
MTSERVALLIADIGGYTDYMSTHRFSLAHAEVNTGRILGRMIDAAPGFDLIEIEGDAAFLSRRVDGREPDRAISEVLSAAASMHRAFHAEREYVATNLCPCSGCKQVGNLKLKFVAHTGEVATQTIRGRLKLVGIDVIHVHRMLKNPVDIPEYVLVSDELYRTDLTAMPTSVQEISQDLEGIGTVREYFVDVTDLDAPLPALPAPSWRTRLGRTFTAAGLGMPYLLGLRKRRAVKTAT